MRYIKYLIFIFLFFAYIPIVFAMPLTLKESIEIAKKTNPYVISKEKMVEALEGKVGQAFSQFLPKIGLEGNIGRSYQQPISISAQEFGIPITLEGTLLPDEATNVYNYRATLTQNIFTGGKLYNNLSISRKSLEIAKESLREANINLVYDVTLAYYGVLKAKKAVKLSEEFLNMAKSHLDQVKTMFDAGIVTKADILRSEVQVINNQIALTKAKSAYEIAKDNFNRVLGRNLSEEVEIAEEEFMSQKLPSPRYEDVLNFAYESRPDYKQFILSEEIAKDSLSLAKAGWFPNIALVGTYGRTKTEYQNANRTDDLGNWSALISGSWDIFDGFLTLNKVKEAERTLSAKSFDEENIRKAIALEVREACFNFETALETLDMAKKALELAEENYRVSELRYNSGVGTNIEVLDAQTSLTQAEFQNLEAQYNYEIAKVKINKVAGKEVFEVGEAFEQKLITIIGKVKFIPLEGGFIGFEDDFGNKYDLIGSKVLDIKKGVSESSERLIKITGKPRKEIFTIHMWGEPFEVLSFEWL